LSIRQPYIDSCTKGMVRTDRYLGGKNLAAAR
jgi:hypothetical protein